MILTRRQLRQLIIEHMTQHDDPDETAAVYNPRAVEDIKRSKSYLRDVEDAWWRTSCSRRSGDPDDPESWKIIYPQVIRDPESGHARTVHEHISIWDLSPTVLRHYFRYGMKYRWISRRRIQCK